MTVCRLASAEEMAVTTSISWALPCTWAAIWPSAALDVCTASWMAPCTICEKLEPDPAAASGSSFSQMVQGAIQDAVQTSKAAEGQMAAHVQGKAQLIDVVTAISSAEASLQTVMAVRDEVISAYQEIMHMTI